VLRGKTGRAENGVCTKARKLSTQKATRSTSSNKTRRKLYRLYRICDSCTARQRVIPYRNSSKFTDPLRSTSMSLRTSTKASSSSFMLSFSRQKCSSCASISPLWSSSTSAKSCRSNLRTKASQLHDACAAFILHSKPQQATSHATSRNMC
jgi:hypothetical protein